MEGPIDEDSLPREPERNSATAPRKKRASVRRKRAKRTYPMMAMQSTTSATQAPPFISALLENNAELTRGVELTDQQRKHNLYKEYVKGSASVATMAPVPALANERLRGFNGWHPSIYQMNGFTGGMSTAHQLNILKILHASVVARGPGPGPPTRPFWNGSSSRDSAWYPTIAQATTLTGLTHLTRPTGMRTVDRGNILENQHNCTSENGYARSVARGPGQTPSPCWNEYSPWDSAWLPSIFQSAGLGLSVQQALDQNNILKTRQHGPYGYVYTVAIDPSQTTTSPYRNILPKPMDTPVDRRTKRWTTERWTTAEVDIDSTTETTERKGKWTTVEDEKLRCAAEMFAGTRWRTIATLIPGRTKKQCWNRWHYALDPNIVRMTERKGKWLKEEDDKLVSAVRKYDGKNWDAIAGLVPSRTKRQCMDRWHKVLDTVVC